MESIEGIIVGAEVLGHLELPSDGAVEHATECDRDGMDAEPYDPARILIHDDQDPMGTQRCRFAAEQIHTPLTRIQSALKRPLEKIPSGTSLPEMMSSVQPVNDLVRPVRARKLEGFRNHGCPRPDGR